MLRRLGALFSALAASVGLFILQFDRDWTRKSRRVGRPEIPKAIRTLIREMQAANVGWGAPRIHGELLKLGIEISQATASETCFSEELSASTSDRWPEESSLLLGKK